MEDDAVDPGKGKAELSTGVSAINAVVTKQERMQKGTTPINMVFGP